MAVRGAPGGGWEGASSRRCEGWGSVTTWLSTWSLPSDKVLSFLFCLCTRLFLSSFTPPYRCHSLVLPSLSRLTRQTRVPVSPIVYMPTHAYCAACFVWSPFSASMQLTNRASLFTESACGSSEIWINGTRFQVFVESRESDGALLAMNFVAFKFTARMVLNVLYCYSKSALKT